MTTGSVRALGLAAIRRVAIVDDDDDAAKALELTLEDAAFEPFRMTPHGASVDDFVEEIVRRADAVVCDQRLRYGALLDVAGAELASKLLARDIPVVLVTQYLDQEADVSIRKYRGRLPVVLRRSEADGPDELRAAFDRCLLELQRGRVRVRKPQRTLLRVADLQKLGTESVVDAVVHGWNSQDAVRFPLSLIPGHLRPQIQIGSVLTAMTNLQATDKNELYFEDFEIAPPPDPNDGFV